MPRISHNLKAESDLIGGMVFKVLLFIIILNFVACASTPDSTPTFSISDDQYEDVIETYTDQTQKYDGPYNILEVSATLLNSHVIEAQMLRQASVFHWDKTKYQTELESKQNGAKTKTEFFVSFFTPDKKSGELTRTNTLWKTLLKINDIEYVGTPKKLSLLPVEIKNLYPRYNRWSNPYVITFDVPMNQVEKSISELVLTGPVGTASLKFKSIK